MCFGADWIAPYPKNDQDLLLGPVSARAATHWFGTDELGRDQLTEVLYAGQISLKIGFAVALISTDRRRRPSARSPATSAGATDQLLMRLTDLFLVVPQHRDPRRRAQEASARATP